MSNMPKQAYASIGGMATGAVSILSSFALFFADKGDSIYKNTYGGDAYTGIQNAAAATGNNLMDLSSICSRGFGLLLLIIGLALIFYFLHQFLAETAAAGEGAEEKPEKADKTPAAEQAVVDEKVAGDSEEQKVEEPQESDAEGSEVSPADSDETPGAPTWTCECGYVTDGAFCPQCGKAREPQPES